MPDRDSLCGKQTLADRLRREAMEERPRFSPALHRRLCDAILASHVRTASAPPGPAGGRRWRRALAIAASVVVLLGAAAMLVWRGNSGGGEPLAHGVSSQPGGTVALPPSWTHQRSLALDAPTGRDDAFSGLEMVGLLTGRVAEDVGLLMERAVIERLVEDGRRAYHAIDNRVPLNAACALILGTATTDSP